MNIILYFIIFAMGSVFGSFLTLATYRIPLNQNITHERSYCPKCNHKLSFLDMIPILSYIFLKAKCKYCNNKIGTRYFLIEVMCGFSFVILALILNINIYYLTINNIIEFFIGTLYILFIFLIGGIDKEHKEINKKVIIYGIIITFIYIVYQYINNTDFNIYRIIIYLILISLITIINTNQIKKKGENKYYLNILILCIIINLFFNEVITITTIIFAVLVCGIKWLINKVFNKKNKYIINIKKQPIGYYLCIGNFLTILFSYIIYLVK